MQIFPLFLSNSPSYGIMVTPTIRKEKNMKNNNHLPTPTPEIVRSYLIKWDKLDRYPEQERAIDRLYFEYAPKNEDLEDILLKSATLNDFYSTRIRVITSVGKHIQSMHIDQRLDAGDLTLVDELKVVPMGGRTIQFYSFTTKYCSHHRPDIFPIYDSLVSEVFRYFKKKDNFHDFKNEELKIYLRFHEIYLAFRDFYDLGEFSLKELDKYLWLMGKEYFK